MRTALGSRGHQILAVCSLCPYVAGTVGSSSAYMKKRMVKNVNFFYGDGKPACLINVLHSLHVEDSARAMHQPLPGGGAGAVHLSPDMKSVS